jgi:hypothetical protein
MVTVAFMCASGKGRCNLGGATNSIPPPFRLTLISLRRPRVLFALLVADIALTVGVIPIRFFAFATAMRSLEVCILIVVDVLLSHGASL